MPASHPTLSAILCNYNHGRYVARAIEAIASQSRRPDELIVVDDGSTDDSCEVIAACVTRHPWITFVRQESNRGFHESFRSAVDAATGDYVYGGAADDYVLPGFFEQAMQLLARFPQAGVLSGKLVMLEPTGMRLNVFGMSCLDRPAFLTPAEYLRDFLGVETAGHSLSAATIYRRDALCEVGGIRQELGSWGDTFAIRAIGLRYGFCYLPQECAVWNVLPDSLSQSAARDPRHLFDIIDRVKSLMRSEAFRGTFPEAYVVRWERQFRDETIEGYLCGASRGYHQVQATARHAATLAGPLDRLVLGFLRRLMTLAYRICFRWMKRIVRRATR